MTSTKKADRSERDRIPKSVRKWHNERRISPIGRLERDAGKEADSLAQLFGFVPRDGQAPEGRVG